MVGSRGRTAAAHHPCVMDDMNSLLLDLVLRITLPLSLKRRDPIEEAFDSESCGQSLIILVSHMQKL